MRHGFQSALNTLGLAAIMAIGGALPIQAIDAQPAMSTAAPAIPSAFRRLNETQYFNAIRDVFGADIVIPGRFDPPRREHGLLAVGDAKVAVTPSSLEQNELRARNIAAQALSEAKRGRIMPCTPQAGPAFDEGCARTFVTVIGRRLWRRPLDADETASILKISSATARSSGDFHKGLEAGLARLLTSPNFLFRIEWATGGRLDDHALATRLSFLLWNAPPDVALLDAAAAGELGTQAGLSRQVERMMASDRFEQGVRAFFSDMFAYEGFDGLSKDQSLYPIYTSQLAKDAREQTLRTIVDLLITDRGDYRELFTTRKTFMNRNLGALYGVAVESASVAGWAPYMFGADEGRAGLLTLAAFLMLDPTHEGRSSPTTRGKSIRELMLCQDVPLPPANVDFTAFEEASKAGLKTARERLAVHSENPACAGCHALTDPIGLALENFDAIGNFRTLENGVAIDPGGRFDDKPYASAVELQRLLKDSPDLPACVTQRVFAYATGRPIAGGDEGEVRKLGEAFARDRYNFVHLIGSIALSEAFRSVAPHTLLTSR